MISDAACAGMDTDIWFEQTPSYDPQLAREICQACPARMDCLLEAIRTHTRDGIFGGLTPSQRDRYRKATR